MIGAIVAPAMSLDALADRLSWMLPMDGMFADCLPAALVARSGGLEDRYPGVWSQVLANGYYSGHGGSARR